METLSISHKYLFCPPSWMIIYLNLFKLAVLPQPFAYLTPLFLAAIVAKEKSAVIPLF